MPVFWATMKANCKLRGADWLEMAADHDGLMCIKPGFVA
jgi:hypothetical protein